MAGGVRRPFTGTSLGCPLGTLPPSPPHVLPLSQERTTTAARDVEGSGPTPQLIATRRVDYVLGVRYPYPSETSFFSCHIAVTSAPASRSLAPWAAPGQPRRSSRS